MFFVPQRTGDTEAKVKTLLPLLPFVAKNTKGLK